ncbi:hypothetical protein FRC11_009101, partial [Ceratobasidium sp. 423]
MRKRAWGRADDWQPASPPISTWDPMLQHPHGLLSVLNMIPVTRLFELIVSIGLAIRILSFLVYCLSEPRAKYNEGAHGQEHSMSGFGSDATVPFNSRIPVNVHHHYSHSDFTERSNHSFEWENFVRWDAYCPHCAFGVLCIVSILWFGLGYIQKLSTRHKDGSTCHRVGCLGDPDEPEISPTGSPGIIGTTIQGKRFALQDSNSFPPPTPTTPL